MNRAMLERLLESVGLEIVEIEESPAEPQPDGKEIVAVKIIAKEKRNEVPS